MGGHLPLPDSWSDLHSERRRLVRFCAYLTGNPEAAEDMAQEALVEAWRHEGALRDPEKRQEWLLGIARNACKRWRRAQARAMSSDTRHAGNTSGSAELSAARDNIDLEIELERGELAVLLDRALALLPRETRDVLVLRFINDLTHPEIAERMRLSEGAVRVRLHRGKLALRRVLATEFGDDLQSYGYSAAISKWQETRVWCAECGERKLQIRRTDDRDTIDFRCPGCRPAVSVTSYPLTNPRFAAHIGNLNRPASILKRGSEWLYPYFTATEIGGCVHCTRCGADVTVRRYQRDRGDWSVGQRTGVYVSCKACGEEVSCSLNGLVLATPVVAHFRQEHGRVQILPPRTFETGGRRVHMTRIQAVTKAAALEVVSDAGTYRVIEIDEASRAEV